jgi:lysophospholipase L1-like esterase
LLLEGVLRIQQKFGPIWDLSFSDATLEGLSDVINHKPLRKTNHILSNSEMYGEFTGHSYTTYYDNDGLRINAQRIEQQHFDEAIVALFMGDSFMQGYDDSNTIPQHIWSNIRAKKDDLSIKVYNAACASYSPAIFIPQAKILIPKVRPDFVVVDIDETDLGDDYIRYRKLIVRDYNGKNIAVRKTPINFEANYRLVDLKDRPFYTTRLLMSLYHKKIYMPLYIKRYRNDNRHVLSFLQDKDENAKEKYKNEIAFFNSNVVELVETLIDLMGDKRRILLLYHPHLQHLLDDNDNRYWNNFVSKTVKDVANQYDVAFYDATEDLKGKFGDNPKQYYWNKNIHFNFKGLKVYGELVTHALLGLIESAQQTVNN